MSKNKMRNKKSDYGFKTHSEAWQAADKDWPIGVETLNKIHAMNTWPPKTKEDFRWYILFNIITVMMRELNNDIDTTHWMRIQHNIECSVNDYFK